MVKECGRSPNHEVRADEGRQGKGVNHTPIGENEAREEGKYKKRSTPGGDRYAHRAIGRTASPARSSKRG
eukprot:9038382-Heterocapsa_arctica.AAC.1